MKITTKWIVRAYTGWKTGWVDFKEFTNPADADNWLCDYCRKNHYDITDFNIVII